MLNTLSSEIVQNAPYETLLNSLKTFRFFNHSGNLASLWGLLLWCVANTCLIRAVVYINTQGEFFGGFPVGRKTSVSTEKLLRESGYSEKTIEAIFKLYGQHQKNKPNYAVSNLD
jgi:hypothetical protein